MAARKQNNGRAASGRKGKAQAASGRKGSGEGTNIRDEIALILILAVAVLLFLCNFGIIGPAGDKVSGVLFGILGFMAYVFPVALFLFLGVRLANKNEAFFVRFVARMKLLAAAALFCMLGIVLDMITGASLELETYDLSELYSVSAEGKCGGGVLFGTIAYCLNHFLAKTGAMLVILVISIICIVIITEKSLLRGVKKGSRMVYENAREGNDRRRERQERRREEQRRRQEEERLAREQEEQEKILRMDRKVSGVSLNTELAKDKRKKKEEPERLRGDDLHEIILNKEEEEAPSFERIQIHMSEAPHVQADLSEVVLPKEETEMVSEVLPEELGEALPVRMNGEVFGGPAEADGFNRQSEKEEKLQKPKEPIQEAARTPAPEPKPGRRPVGKPAEYLFPPLRLLKESEKKGGGDTTAKLRETARHLQKTLETFGVRVTVTDISQGPTVTRYELQPEAGVKVSRIVGLADDIKLNLAATDIRIEAPIPGKAAVGIEVPNKENSMVALRDLLESREFQEFPSNLAFAVGKDIGGKTIVADIAKMPHMLIAGSTGSGKSVCINTLIMSLLYKASPEDVKLIMVDPKVVELSVYNGIPHLLIPVVTDPKKAAAALHWGVAEMEDRYKKFADLNVRDLKGYNKKAGEGAKEPGAPEKLPQIVIIVDELADLMMVSPGEVEESICRLAQLARAAGIHLIIATQRPSVDVITGLIKANMPSRVAFAVSSGVDSRTILDMNGAEKLLGKGDMLFFPQGYPKPARIQGAFVSDKEVGDVVEFLKNQSLGNLYSEDIEQKIQTMHASSGSGGEEGAGAERDSYFAEAGRFIIEKDKASIGLIQRAFKVGFNRAARIMDQLYEAGVVGEEEGTKPRRILMSPEQFEQYLEEYL